VFNSLKLLLQPVALQDMMEALGAGKVRLLVATRACSAHIALPVAVHSGCLCWSQQPCRT
jgi:hypothetical protein